MAQKVIRYDARFDAKVLLEELVVEDWVAIDGRGFESKTSEGSRIEVFPDYLKAVVHEEPGVNLDELERSVRAVLAGASVPDRNLISFIDPEDCEIKLSHLKRLAEQVNECYAVKAYDAVAVLMRRIIESLIIECFEAKNLSGQIKKPDGSYFMLAELIVEAERVNQHGGWRLTAKTREALPLVKEIGDQAAHGRYHATKKRDVDDVRYRFNVAMSNLRTIAGLD